MLLLNSDWTATTPASRLKKLVHYYQMVLVLLQQVRLGTRPEPKTAVQIVWTLKKVWTAAHDQDAFSAHNTQISP